MSPSTNDTPQRLTLIPKRRSPEDLFELAALLSQRRSYPRRHSQGCNELGRVSVAIIQRRKRGFFKGGTKRNEFGVG